MGLLWLTHLQLVLPLPAWSCLDQRCRRRLWRHWKRPKPKQWRRFLGSDWSSGIFGIFHGPRNFLIFQGFPSVPVVGDFVSAVPKRWSQVTECMREATMEMGLPSLELVKMPWRCVRGCGWWFIRFKKTWPPVRVSLFCWKGLGFLERFHSGRCLVSYHQLSSATVLSCTEASQKLSQALEAHQESKAAVAVEDALRATVAEHRRPLEWSKTGKWNELGNCNCM